MLSFSSVCHEVGLGDNVTHLHSMWQHFLWLHKRLQPSRGVCGRRLSHDSSKFRQQKQPSHLIGRETEAQAGKGSYPTGRYRQARASTWNFWLQYQVQRGDGTDWVKSSSQFSMPLLWTSAAHLAQPTDPGPASLDPQIHGRSGRKRKEGGRDGALDSISQNRNGQGPYGEVEEQDTSLILCLHLQRLPKFNSMSPFRKAAHTGSGSSDVNIWAGGRRFGVVTYLSEISIHFATCACWTCGLNTQLFKGNF